ncbi:SMI1/KNR4 family protein [Nonomuraea sp. ATR24]|uniref:SMI1/KNR4 family protein n=1 Tax=Nonomuraea TaxID=83681 RepID=UPI001C5FB8EE|nr:SMI1/KNR4 family protein [Nonomuraea ceibae]
MTEDEIFEAVRSAPGPDVLAVASPQAVAEAEEAIGYPLPSLLRRLYLEVGNGGFGPRGGIIGVRGYDFWKSDIFADITESALAFRTEPYGRRAGMIQLLDWGCAIASLLDCRDPEGAMWGWDPNLCCLDHALFPQNITFASWLTESIGREFAEPFYDGYFEVLPQDGAEIVVSITGEAEEDPCRWSPPVWVKGRKPGTWARRHMSR